MSHKKIRTESSISINKLISMATKGEIQNNKIEFEPWLELNKVVMVTGASSGLGWEFCCHLAKSGCRIIAAARRADRLESLCNKIKNEFPLARAVAIELDISATEAVIAAQVNKSWNVFGRIDALINNAGVTGNLHAPLDLSEEEWDNVIRTNQRGTWLVSKLVCKKMCDSGQEGGCVINISSFSAVNRVIFSGGHSYVASKSAINTISKVMAMELGQYGIRVNSICPGIFESEITNGLMKKPWLKKVLSRTVPLGTFGTVNPALTSLVSYLIHDSSPYITGNNFIVDAGATLVGVPIFSSL
ncbi:uncharacterized protein LOC127256606 [Andrographis paniculata]|uniref:uncharacterized protein LOC127256606 n=1 Tax=Andrographis paniculata TaxID=175694 RepID=UPI0021E9258E|nr:uncharacterized protein LOC127256606 [Andrographis paniculata]